MCTPITLFNPDEPLRRIHTTAFLGCGASVTMIKTQIATHLNLKIEEQPLSLETFGNDEDQIHPSSRTTVGLLLENDDSIMLKVRTLSFFTQPMKMGLAKDHIHRDMPACSTTTQPETSKRIRSRPHQTRKYHQWKTSPYSSICYGAKLYRYAGKPNSTPQIGRTDTEVLVAQSVGIIDDVSKSDDERCLQKFNDTIYFSTEEGRYMVRLPSKEDISLLSDNFNMAMSLLSSTVNALKKHYGLLDKYHNIIKDQLQKGIIEEVKQGDTSSTCHYLPHHGVISESSKNTKLRCVYDGSAKTKGKKSLNDILFRGLVLLPEIAGILIRIRFMNILITGDI
ncbi:hypothetical protein RB195_011442 [Necator americanus]